MESVLCLQRRSAAIPAALCVDGFNGTVVKKCIKNLKSAQEKKNQDSVILLLPPPGDILGCLDESWSARMVMMVARRARKGRQVDGVGDCVGGDGVRDSKRGRTPESVCANPNGTRTRVKHPKCLIQKDWTGSNVVQPLANTQAPSPDGSDLRHHGELGPGAHDLLPVLVLRLDLDLVDPLGCVPGQLFHGLEHELAGAVAGALGPAAEVLLTLIEREVLEVRPKVEQAAVDGLT